MQRLMVHIAWFLAGVGLLMGSVGVGHAVPTTYTDKASFDAAIAGFSSTTLDFNSLSADTLIPSGRTVEGIMFTYSIAGETLKVTDDFVTPSSDPATGNMLGLTGGNEALLGGDSFKMTFDQTKVALGLWVITTPDLIFADDFTLSISTGSVSNISGTPELSLEDNGQAFFLGLLETGGFTMVELTTSGPFFEYNVDDIITATALPSPVPEPSTLVLLSTGLLGTVSWRRRRRGLSRA